MISEGISKPSEEKMLRGISRSVEGTPEVTTEGTTNSISKGIQNGMAEGITQVRLEETTIGEGISKGLFEWNIGRNIQEDIQ